MAQRGPLTRTAPCGCSSSTRGAAPSPSRRGCARGRPPGYGPARRGLLASAAGGAQAEGFGCQSVATISRSAPWECRRRAPPRNSVLQMRCSRQASLHSSAALPPAPCYPHSRTLAPASSACAPSGPPSRPPEPGPGCGPAAAPPGWCLQGAAGGGSAHVTRSHASACRGRQAAVGACCLDPQAL